jgi:hypothetical protein
VEPSALEAQMALEKEKGRASLPKKVKLGTPHSNSTEIPNEFVWVLKAGQQPHLPRARRTHCIACLYL